MTSPLDPGQRGASTVPAEPPRSPQIPEGQTRKGSRIQAVAVNPTQGLSKPRLLASVPIQAKLGTRISMSFARPFASISRRLFGPEPLPGNFQSLLKTAIDSDSTQLFRLTVTSMTPPGHDNLPPELVSEEVPVYESPNLTAHKRNGQMHRQWMGCRVEGEPILFYLAKRGNKAITEAICRNPDIGLSSLELERLSGSQFRVIPGDLNKNGLAGYGGSPFAFALDNGNLGTALAMAENGGTLQHGGAKAVFRKLSLTSDQLSELKNAFSARKQAIEGALSDKTAKKRELESAVQQMRTQYGQLISWESLNYDNFDNYPEPELNDADWKTIKDRFSASKKAAESQAKRIKLLEAQLDNVKADLALVNERL